MGSAGCFYVIFFATFGKASRELFMVENLAVTRSDLSYAQVFVCSIVCSCVLQSIDHYNLAVLRKVRSSPTVRVHWHQLADARTYRTYVTCYSDSVLFFQLGGYHCGKNTVETYQKVELNWFSYSSLGKVSRKCFASLRSSVTRFCGFALGGDGVI